MVTGKESGHQDSQDVKTIQLVDGNEYELAPMTVNLMIEVENKFDLSYFELIQKRRVIHTRYILYLRLRVKYPHLTEEKIGELVTTETLMEIAKIYGME